MKFGIFCQFMGFEILGSERARTLGRYVTVVDNLVPRLSLRTLGTRLSCGMIKLRRTYFLTCSAGVANNYSVCFVTVRFMLRGD